MVVGNSARFTVDLYSYIRHAAPEPGIIYHYSNFFTPADLRSTTVRYTLEATARKLPTDLNQTDWPSVAPYSWVQVDVPSPVVGWLVPTTKSKDLYHGARNDQLTSGLYPFSRAQINESFPLYLNTGMALPRYDCWFQICTHKAAKSAVSTDLGKQFILDILPATLDDFVGWSQLGPQIDPDGDGLVAAVDPDQTKWDSDGDGLPDGVEYEYGSKRGYGFNPHKADADNDGLNDAAETRYGTDPRKADSDDFLPDPADTDAGDTTGDLLGWSLEVCVDNGNPPTPPPTPTATATPEPAPVNGMPVAPPPTATESTPVAISTVCVLTADDYEEDDTSASAASFDLANQNNGVRTFDSLIDSDWITFTAFANLRYTFAVNLMSGNDGVTLALYDVDGLTHLVSAENQVSFTPTADGLYYLRAKSAAGMVSPCNVSYSIGVSVINPNATPVPTAEGTPVRNRYRNSVSSCGVRPAVNRYCSTPP